MLLLPLAVEAGWGEGEVRQEFGDTPKEDQSSLVTWRLAVLETFCLASPEEYPLLNFKSMNDDR